jgi:hypothetical protein
VTEELIVTFLGAYYAKERAPLSLEIFDCAAISNSTKHRLDLTHTKLKESKVKKEVQSLDPNFEEGKSGVGNEGERH